MAPESNLSSVMTLAGRIAGPDDVLVGKRGSGNDIDGLNLLGVRRMMLLLG